VIKVIDDDLLNTSELNRLNKNILCLNEGEVLVQRTIFAHVLM